MAKPWITIILSSMMLIAMPLVHGIDQDPLAVEEWFKNLPSMTQKQTHIHFYLHDLVSGASPTAMRVVQSSITASLTVMELGIAPSRLFCHKKNNRRSDSHSTEVPTMKSCSQMSPERLLTTNSWKCQSEQVAGSCKAPAEYFQPNCSATATDQKQRPFNVLVSTSSYHLEIFQLTDGTWNPST
ncbi:hypothetical protein L1887_17923 [Cichorium endivia]|nr:hypothetical protein L1887_17923 [Cichorium endivia]